MTKSTRPFAYVFTSVIVSLAMGCASTAKHEGTGEYVDDMRLK